jgi:hypothetical protein
VVREEVTKEKVEADGTITKHKRLIRMAREEGNMEDTKARAIKEAREAKDGMPNDRPRHISSVGTVVKTTLHSSAKSHQILETQSCRSK